MRKGRVIHTSQSMLCEEPGHATVSFLWKGKDAKLCKEGGLSSKLFNQSIELLSAPKLLLN